MRDVAPQPSPVFPKPVYARAEVTSIAGVGKLLASHASSRKFFCPAEDSHCAQTQFSGSVSKTYETIEDCEQDGYDDDDDSGEELCSVAFAGELLRYYPSRPLALKTSRIAVLKLEAQWQRCSLGELTGEVRERWRDQEERDTPCRRDANCSSFRCARIFVWIMKTRCGKRGCSLPHATGTFAFYR